MGDVWKFTSVFGDVMSWWCDGGLTLLGVGLSMLVFFCRFSFDMHQFSI
jgi:hypothetical protein